jgi:hypothetical protein
MGTCLEQYTSEEQHVTSQVQVMRIIALVPVSVCDGALALTDNIPDELKDKMVRYEGYLRWTAGLRATHWLPGGPANFPDRRGGSHA